LGSGERDISAWYANPVLVSGEQFEIESKLADPSIQELQAAGNDYPEWVLDRYLQLPEDFSPLIRDLAEEITRGVETPYDRAVAITNYLRREIKYVNPLPEPPPDQGDPLEWMLFDTKIGFCNYYATAEVMMLRSIGIPARMAVGFAQGELDPQTETYTVRNLDAHAWPEVYFPEIGWVEFEPTGNQAALFRPNRPTGEESTGPNRNPGLDEAEASNHGLFAEERAFNNLNNQENNFDLASQQRRIDPWILLGIAVVLVALLWGLNRQYALLERLPSQIQTAFENNGGQAPKWIRNWARWNSLTPIERSYESINRCLRLLGETPRLFTTPAKRSAALIKRLPKATRPIKTLTAQHQAALYSRQPGHERLAKRASLAIWMNTLETLLKNFVNSFDDRFSSGRFG